MSSCLSYFSINTGWSRQRCPDSNTETMITFGKCLSCFLFQPEVTFTNISILIHLLNLTTEEKYATPAGNRYRSRHSFHKNKLKNLGIFIVIEMKQNFGTRKMVIHNNTENIIDGTCKQRGCFKWNGNQKEYLHESEETDEILCAHKVENLANMTLEAYIERKRDTVSNLPNQLVLSWQNKKRSR